MVGKEYVCPFWGGDKVIYHAMILNYMVYTLLKLSEYTFKICALTCKFYIKRKILSTNMFSKHTVL